MPILTPAAVRSIRTAVLAGHPMAELSREYGAHETTIAAAVYGQTWRHITDPGPLPRPDPTGRRPANTTLTPGKVRSARRRWADGEPLSQIAARYGVRDATIRAAIHGITWAHVTSPPPAPVRPTGGRDRAIVGDALEQARAMRADGATMAAIAVTLGVTVGTVSRALAR